MDWLVDWMTWSLLFDWLIDWLIDWCVASASIVLGVGCRFPVGDSAVSGPTSADYSDGNECKWHLSTWKDWDFPRWMSAGVAVARPHRHRKRWNPHPFVRTSENKSATRTWQKQIKIQNFSLLHCPAVFGRFLDPPRNHPRGAIFPTVD